MNRSFRPKPLAVMTLVLIAAGVSAGNALAQTVTRTVDAANEWVFVSLTDPSGIVSVTDPAASTAWDVAFLGTEVMVNGGATGPGGVTVHCICQNRSATNDEVQYMTPESELAAFDGVGRAQVPRSDDAWDPATFATTQWYRYNLRDEHFVWPVYDVYLIRRGDAVHKLQITGYYGRAGEPRQITFRHAPIPR